MPDSTLAPVLCGSTWDGAGLAVKIGRNGVARELHKLITKGTPMEQGDAARSRMESVRIRCALAALIRGELTGILAARAERTVVQSRPGAGTLREGLLQELAEEILNDVAARTGIDTVQPALTNVVAGGAQRVASAAVRKLCCAIAEKRNMAYRDVLTSLFAAPDGDILRTCADLAVPEGEGGETRELLLEAVAAVIAAALAHESYRVMGLSAHLAAAYGTMLGSTAFARADRLAGEWTALGEGKEPSEVSHVGELPRRESRIPAISLRICHRHSRQHFTMPVSAPSAQSGVEKMMAGDRAALHQHQAPFCRNAAQETF